MEALEEYLLRYGVLGIFNVDQGAQYTSEAFTVVLKEPRGKVLHGCTRSLGRSFVCGVPVVKCEI